MTGRRARGRKPAAVEEPVVDAGQENVIDSTTEPLNGNLQNKVILEEASISPLKRGKSKGKSTKKTKSSKETESIADVVVAVVPVVKSRARGKPIKNMDNDDIQIEKINIVTGDKNAAKRGRKKLIEISETNGDSIQDDKGKLNGKPEIPVDKAQSKRENTRSKTLTVPKQSGKISGEKTTKKPQSKKSISADVSKNSITEEENLTADNDDTEPDAVVQVLRKPKGRKKTDDDILVTGKKHKLNGKSNKSDEEEEIIPMKRGRAAKTKAINNIKENEATTIADDIVEKNETKRTMKKKITTEEKKPPILRRGKRVTGSIEKDINMKDDQKDKNIVEVVEKKSKTVTANKKRKVDDATDISDEKIKPPTKEKKMKINATTTSYENIDFNVSENYNLKISSWNVAGLRAWLTKGGIEYITHEKPDIVCLQEIKCAEDLIPEEARITGYHPYWLCKPGGWNGVAIYSKIMPINVEYGLGNTELDNESRIMTAEYEKFYLICVYVPNAGRKLVTLPKRLRWNDIFDKYVLKLNDIKPVIICGDMNVAHTEIDLANPKSNKRNAGFTQEERDGMSTLLSYGFIDTYRHFNPNKKDAYTFWTYMANARAKNVGWRLDYFLASEKLMPKIVDNVIRSKVLGSDHCPITLFLNI